ncbi:MAG: SRPBCC domain-containing protein [Chloroflexi bacterium]|nr:SRPBCC domain-containing protein [Chloroflexota bacterium]
MKFYEASADIKANPETVWKVLTDGQGFTEWDSGITKFEGRITIGETIKLFTEVSPGRAFPVKVAELVPNERMKWTGGMPLGLFKGQRTFTLSAASEGVTKLTTREEFSGVMLPLMWNMMPDLQPSFDKFVKGVKTKAESS